MTPTREEVERVIERMLMNAPAVPMHAHGTIADPHINQAAAMLRALRERLEAAEADAEFLKNNRNQWQDAATVARRERDALKAAVFGSSDFWADLPIGNFCEMARTTEAARKGALDQLTAALPAVKDAEWNAAIEEAVFALGGSGHPDASDLRALRRNPKEGV